MDYEKAYNDLIARINEAKEKPSLCMKDKHHYNGYVETGIRDALNYILNPESEDERIRKFLIDILSQGTWRKEWPFGPNEVVAYLERQKDFKYSEEQMEDIRQYAYNKGIVDAEEKQKEQHPTAEEVLIRAGLKPFKDGNQWCILAGDNIQEGVCGFGDTIEDALYEFLKDFCEQRKPVSRCL